MATSAQERRWLRALRIRLVMVRLLPGVHRTLTIVLAALILAAGIIPVAFTYASGSVVGAVPAALQAGGFGTPGGRALVGWLIAAAVLFFLQQVSSVALQTASGSLGTRMETSLRLRAMRASLAPTGVGHLEDPAMLDKVQLAQGVGGGAIWQPRLAVGALAQILTSRVNAIGSAVLVAAFRWWIPLVLVAVWLLVRRRLRADLMNAVDVMRGQTQEMRRSNYFRDLALSPPAAKETRVFGLTGWVRDRFNLHWHTAMREVWAYRRSSWIAFSGLITLLLAAHVLAFVLLARAAVAGDISIGMLAIVAGAIMGVSNVANLSNNDFQLEYALEPIPAVLELERLTAGLRAAAGAADVDGMPAREIRFDGVVFSYPGSDLRVFDGLDLTIEAGRSLAIVGVNGAGKTTLVKLLARLYEPTAGRIAVDGVDLSSLDPDAWRRRVGAIFQDFVRYELPVRDNIGFGALEHLPDTGALDEAARRAGADAIIAGLPRGAETILSRRFTDGVDLSGGQWQRIALARALFAVGADAGVLILDEPTANLDVRAEVEIFDRFLELTRGLTTIVISHRFSTVRRADRIIVLDEGRVVEDGSHDELMALDGRYAEMFRLQAERFRLDADEEAVLP